MVSCVRTSTASDEDALVEGEVARHERQHVTLAGPSNGRARFACASSIEPEERLLWKVLCRSLTTTEMNTSPLHQKNVKVLRLGIEESDRLARKRTSPRRKRRDTPRSKHDSSSTSPGLP